jgi:formate dehydrogenase major subunit
MALVKVEINGQRILVDDSRTILQAARENGITDIPTLCHDEQLEPFASCFLCVVKVQGARTLLPSCSTRVSAGMVVETNTDEVRRTRRAALELLLSNHYADCVGPCQLACPAGVDIQGYIALAALGRFAEAVELIKKTNPLPSICGRVCTRPCEVSGCRRGLLDQAVGIDYIKRYVADLHLGKADAPTAKVAPPNGHRVAVVGAGPAGLSCAYYLALRGYSVDIFEAMPEAGGMLRYGIPEYRLPKDVLDLEVGQILDLGVRLHTNRSLGADFTIGGLKREGYQAVFLGIGAWESQGLRVEGEDAEGVLAGIDFLRSFGLRRKIDLHGRVVVVGGGNTAIDCARTALRLGADEVRLLYRRTRAEMPANDLEIEEAIQEGVAIDYLVAPTRVLRKGDAKRVAGLECKRMELGEQDASGRRSPRPVPGSEFVVEADFVLAAIGQAVRVADLISSVAADPLPGETLALTPRRTLQVDEATKETSIDGVFAGGDVVTGAATAVEAIAAGRKAAHAIDRYILTGRAAPEPRRFVSRKDTFGPVTPDDLRSRESLPRRPMPLIPLDERRRGFQEVELGYSLEDLRAEAARCLECGCLSLFDCDLQRYATEYGVEVPRFLGEVVRYPLDRSHPFIELDPNKCILCGRCVRMCSEVVGVDAYGFVKRGFVTTVKPALGGSLLETDCVSCGLCIGTCPTGAIAAKLPLAKPGPWNSQVTVSTCHYCSVGCQLEYHHYGDLLTKVGRVERSPHTMGGHCGKGAFGQEYVQAADRLVDAWEGRGDVQIRDLDGVITRTAARLKELAREGRGEEIAVFVSPRLTNEEAYLAQKLARVGLGTNNVCSLAALVNPSFFEPTVMSTATYHDLAQAEAILVVNSNLDEEHFVVDLLAKRAIRNGGRLVFVGPEENRTTRVAAVHLACRPGAQSWVVAALVRELAARGALDPNAHPDLAARLRELGTDSLGTASGVSDAALAEAAAVLAEARSRVVVFNKDYRGRRLPGDDRLFAAAARALDAPHLALWEKANMQGLLDMGVHPAWFPGYLYVKNGGVQAFEKRWGVVLQGVRGFDSPGELARALAERRIRVAVVLGEDPLGNEELPEEVREGLRAAEYLVVADVVMTATARAADAVLPLSAAVETSGTFTNAERRAQRVRRSIAPRSGLETWQLLCQLGSRMGLGTKMRYASAEDVWAEIRQVVALYRDLHLDSPGGSDGERAGIWDAAARPATATEAALPALRRDAIAQPFPTIGLDALEVRFARRKERLLAEARARLDARPG